MRSTHFSLTLRLVSLLVPCVLFASACFLKQELDENASHGTLKANQTATSDDSSSSSGGAAPGPSTTGAGTSPTGSGGSNPGAGGGAGIGFDASTPDQCDMTRSEARDILEADCAGCHETPGKEANFDFILELDKLKTGVASTGERFVVPGDPGHSRIYQRVSAGEMPPTGKMPRPS